MLFFLFLIPLFKGFSQIPTNGLVAHYPFNGNADDINEVFKPEISCSENFKEYKMCIYNRWGNLIFRSSDYFVGWNGTNNKGKDCSSGVYYCVIEYVNSKNERFSKNTAVTLLR